MPTVLRVASAVMVVLDGMPYRFSAWHYCGPNIVSKRTRNKRHHQMFDAYVASWPKGMECLAKIEADPPLAVFIRACELQERCGGSLLRDFLAMPLQVGAAWRDVVGCCVRARMGELF